MRAASRAQALASQQELLQRAREVTGRAAAALEAHHRLALAALVVLQWAGVTAIALTATHNGWLYHHGGDATFYWSDAHALGHLQLPRTEIGYLVSIVWAPAAAVLGPSLLSGLPFVLLLNGLVLLPLSLLLLYGVAERLAGRLFGLFAAALWLVLPLLAYKMVRPDSRGPFLDIFLAGAVGLNGLGDFPSLVACLAAAWFAFRALDNRSWVDAAAAGVLVGAAIGIKPANALFLPAPALALLVARRPRQLGAYALGMAPGLIALAVWKQRGLGELPISSAYPALREAADPLPLAGLPDISRYGGIDWAMLQSQLAQIREVFWSRTLLEWVPFAGGFALLRRSGSKALLVIVWFAAYFLVKGSSQFASVYSWSFFRLIEPAYPAYALCAAAALVLLFPGRRGQRLPAPRPLARGRLVALVVVLGLVPLVFVAAARPIPTASHAQIVSASAKVPIVELGLTARRTAGAIALGWRARPSRVATVDYWVLRSADANEDCTVLSPGIGDCAVNGHTVGRVRNPGFTDHPGRGTWIYRVAVAASSNGDPAFGDPVLLSRPVTITVP
jgi:hypothetical protein